MVSKGMGRLSSALLALVLLGAPSGALAGVILSPTAVVSNSMGETQSTIDATRNGSGLSIPFTSGVSDFDTYLALSPLHEWIFTDGSEWFSTAGVTQGTIVYDLGALYSVNRLALWNEEFSGIQTMGVETANNAAFVGAASVGNFLPVDSPFDASYPAQVFDVADSVARYIRLTLTGPQVPNRGTYVSMGEIAFDVTPAAVPEPVTLSLLGLGLGAAYLRRRATRH